MQDLSLDDFYAKFGQGKKRGSAEEFLAHTVTQTSTGIILQCETICMTDRMAVSWRGWLKLMLGQKIYVKVEILVGGNPQVAIGYIEGQIREAE